MRLFTATVSGQVQHTVCLDLHLLKTVLPEGGVGGDTVLAEVNQDVPGTVISPLL